jgi:hypothetical protein
MSMTPITAPARSHLLAVFRALVQASWKPVRAPADGRLVRNGQLVVLKSNCGERHFRLFVYKITGSGRQRPHERRIEITSTYQKGLKRVWGHPDIVLGFDADRGLFVGVDPQRIAHGGPTGNASSFFDISGMDWNRNNEILILPRSARLFPGGIEYHAFIRPLRLPEYFFNLQAIHAGTYAGSGLYSGAVRGRQVALAVSDSAVEGEVIVLDGPPAGRVKRRVTDHVVEAYEKGDFRVLRRRKWSPEQFLDLKRRMEENGWLGEEFVMNEERRILLRAGKPDLANRVRWISQESICEGYDILSYEVTGEEKWIEVKATAGNSRVFEMSDFEWRKCVMAGKKYWIYRITLVRTSPSIERIRNPKGLEAQGLITKSASGWRVTLP